MIVFSKTLSDGRRADVLAMAFENYRLCVTHGPDDDCGYDDGWCYRGLGAAVRGALAWDPTVDREPTGWVKHPGTNRYRVRADPAQEFNPNRPPPEGYRHPFSIDHGWTPIPAEEAAHVPPETPRRRLGRVARGPRLDVPSVRAKGEYAVGVPGLDPGPVHRRRHA